MKNNIFYYATSELSQDAFICWLCSFAFDDNTDTVLHNCAKQLLVMFVPDLSGTDFTLLKIERQVEHIDILLTLSVDGKCWKIIIEDKVFTREHNNQLMCYRTQIETKFPDCVVKGVYYKTGFQSDLSAVDEAKYTSISREQMLSFMAPYVSQTANQIFLDYFEYWSAYQDDTEVFRSLPVNKWSSSQIYGFYDSLRKSHFFRERNQWMGYGYVSNKSGGFYGLWFGVEDCCVTINGIPFELYLQLEISPGESTSARLCLKLCAKADKVEKLPECRNKVVYDGNWRYVLSDFNFHKPKVLRAGRHMTIGVYKGTFKTWNNLIDVFDPAIEDYIALLTSLRT